MAQHSPEELDDMAEQAEKWKQRQARYDEWEAASQLLAGGIVTLRKEFEMLSCEATILSVWTPEPSPSYVVQISATSAVHLQEPLRRLQHDLLRLNSQVRELKKAATVVAHYHGIGASSD